MHLSRMKVKILKWHHKRHCKALIFFLLSYQNLLSHTVNSSLILSEQSHLKSQQNTDVQIDLRMSNKNSFMLFYCRTVTLFWVLVLSFSQFCDFLNELCYRRRPQILFSSAMPLSLTGEKFHTCQGAVRSLLNSAERCDLSEVRESV